MFVDSYIHAHAYIHSKHDIMIDHVYMHDRYVCVCVSKMDRYMSYKLVYSLYCMLLGAGQVIRLSTYIRIRLRTYLAGQV